ncbi:MAG: hypothetical protein ABJ201_00620, partial [Nisaea sp.]
MNSTIVELCNFSSGIYIEPFLFVSVLMLIIFHLYFLYYFSFKFEKGKRLGRSYRERMIFFTFDMPRN